MVWCSSRDGRHRRARWPAPQAESASAALARLPARHRLHHASVDPGLGARLLAQDPRFAERPADTIPTCEGAGFVIESSAGGGCGLLLPTLAGQVSSYDPRSWEHNLVLAGLFRDEAALMAAGRLRDEMMMFVARPRP